jgi:hypothetical protein
MEMKAHNISEDEPLSIFKWKGRQGELVWDIDIF